MRNFLFAAILVLHAPMARAQPPQSVPAGTPVVDNPTGEGDPDAMTCRKAQHQVQSRLLGPVVCKTNGIWAQYRKDGMDVSADGGFDVKSEKANSLNPTTCTMVGGGSTSNAAMGMMRYICN